VGSRRERASTSIHYNGSNSFLYGRQIGTRVKDRLVVGTSREKSSGIGTQKEMSMGYHLLVLGACALLCFIQIHDSYYDCSRCTGCRREGKQ